MSLRLKGTLLGFGASLGGVVLWVILDLAGVIAGLAGAAIGILFIVVYSKINPEDDSKYPYIFAGVLILLEILLALFICFIIAISKAANEVGVTFAKMIEALRLYPEAQQEITDIMVKSFLIGIVLSYAVFVSYLYSIKKKKKEAALAVLLHQQSGTHENQTTQSNQEELGQPHQANQAYTQEGQTEGQENQQEPPQDGFRLE